MRTQGLQIGAAVLLLGICRIPAAVLYVDLNSTIATAPYAGWLTAATNIQDAIDAAAPGDVVMVTNGIYANGGRPLTGYSLTNRLTVDKPITVQSVNGPLVTIVKGYQMPDSINGDSAIRCAYLARNAVLAGFTLTNGATLYDEFETFDFHLHMGGGVSCEAGASVGNCIISGCAANDMGGGFYGDGGYDGISTNVLLTNCVITGCQAPYGGGAIGGILNNCSISNNIGEAGGGAQFCVLNGCTISSNLVELVGNGNGGGADFCTLSNCFLFNNSSDNAGGGASRSTLTGCTLVSNTAALNGGGAGSCTLTDCVLSNNFVPLSFTGPFAISQGFGGGAQDSALSNCRLVNNYAGADGGGAAGGALTHCVLVGNHAGSSGGAAKLADLSHCTLSNNVAGYGGGGVEQCTLTSSIISSNYSFYGGGATDSLLTNCVVSGNSGATGGGALNCTAVNCTIFANSTYDTEVAATGGGAEGCTLDNCTLVSNSATVGGGADSSTLNNCIAYYNTNGDTTRSTVNYCCVAVDPGGPGNISDAPLFVDLAGSNFHLQSNSPCINSGDNAYVVSASDFEGNARITGVTVDMGAYEYPTPSSALSYSWAHRYGLATDGSVDYADLDGTGMNNWQKWIAGLNPTNASSVLVMLPPLATTNSGGLTVSWLSVSNRNYFLQRATDLAVPSAFSTIQSNIPGQASTTSYLDATASNGGRYFYRIGVQ